MSARRLRPTAAAQRLSRHPALHGPVVVPASWAPEVEALLAAVVGRPTEVTLVAERDGGLWVTWAGADVRATAILEAAVGASRGLPR